MKHFFNLLFRRKAWAYVTLTGFATLVFFSSSVLATPIQKAEAAYVTQESMNTTDTRNTTANVQPNTDRCSLNELIVLNSLFGGQKGSSSNNPSRDLGSLIVLDRLFERNDQNTTSNHQQRPSLAELIVLSNLFADQNISPQPQRNPSGTTNGSTQPGASTPSSRENQRDQTRDTTPKMMTPRENNTPTSTPSGNNNTSGTTTKPTDTSSRSGGITQHNTPSDRQSGSGINTPTGKTPGQTGDTRQPNQTRETQGNVGSERRNGTNAPTTQPGGGGATTQPGTSTTQPGGASGTGTSGTRGGSTGTTNQGSTDRGTSGQTGTTTSPSSRTPSTSTDISTITDPNLQALVLLERLFNARGGTTVIVEKGDTLSEIAREFLGDASRYPEIARLNNLTNPSLIYPGQRLQLPADTRTAAQEDLARLIILQNLFSPTATSGTSNGTSKNTSSNMTDLGRLIILDRLFND